MDYIYCHWNELEIYDDLPEDGFYVYGPGSTITCIEPNNYLFRLGNLRNEGYLNPGVFCLEIGDTNASPTSSNVLVNGKLIEFEAYTIDGNNYFKLRDLAQVVNKTSKNFEVKWDSNKNAINLISNAFYTSVGGELVRGDNTAKNAIPTTSTVYKDGTELF